jgi:DNA-binding GntR family transcriptional regulator
MAEKFELNDILRDAITEGYLETGAALTVTDVAKRLRWSKAKVYQTLDILRGAPRGIQAIRDGRGFVYAPATWHLRDLLLAARGELENRLNGAQEF